MGLSGYVLACYAKGASKQDGLEPMQIAAKASPGIVAKRRETLSRFVSISAFAGLLLGIFEAALLRNFPRVEFLLVPDIGSVEWFLAPLVDMACFGLWGLVRSGFPPAWGQDAH